MKKIILACVLILAYSAGKAQEQPVTGKKLPSVMVKNLEGKTINTAELNNDGNL